MYLHKGRAYMFGGCGGDDAFVHVAFLYVYIVLKVFIMMRNAKQYFVL